MSVSIEQKTSEFNSVEFKSNQIAEGFLNGLHKSPFHGFSVEFADYKAYNTGESTRFIDWKLFARTDKLFIKNYEQETNLRCTIAIDQSQSMFFPFDKKNYSIDGNLNKFLFSVYACGVIIAMLYKQRDAFSLSLLSDKVDYATDVKSGYVHQKFIYSELEQLLDKSYKDFPSDTNIAPLLHLLAETSHKRSLIIIFTDLLTRNEDEEFMKSLQHLRYNKHEVILFHVIDKQAEEELLYKNRPYKFVDAETKQELKVNPSEIRNKYARLMQSKFSQIHSCCDKMHIDYVQCDINKGFNQVLIPYFYKRLKLH